MVGLFVKDVNDRGCGGPRSCSCSTDARAPARRHARRAAPSRSGPALLLQSAVGSQEDAYAGREQQHHDQDWDGHTRASWAASCQLPARARADEQAPFFHRALSSIQAGAGGQVKRRGRADPANRQIYASCVTLPPVPEVEAHITGTVWKIEVAVGDRVDEGDTVAILESMKMEMPVEAEDAGTVKEILCQEGQAVNEGAGVVKEILVEEGQSVSEGDPLVVLE
jgi:acetyl-CoA carboxylase biotin carboxyl carrier protein